ncbi:MAG: hypothetical protein MJH11_10715 [Lentisphaeria bacterium]|nr:hypothetical protein [Lentisphaeria bacterium]
MSETRLTKVVIIGIGGGAGRVVRKISTLLPGAVIRPMDEVGSSDEQWINLVYMDSDIADLDYIRGVVHAPIGTEWTHGMGTGGDSLLGENLLWTHLKDLEGIVSGAELVITICCLGGGTGSGGIQVLNRYLNEKKILNIAFATEPLTAEGTVRKDISDAAIAALKRQSALLINIHNDLIFKYVPSTTKLTEALKKTNALIAEGILGLAEAVRCRKGIPLKFVDLQRSIWERQTNCSIGTGIASGEGRAKSVVDELLKAPLLGGAEFLQESHKIIAILSGDENLSVQDIERCHQELSSWLQPNTETLIGISTEEKTDQLKLTVLAIKYLDFEDPIHIKSLSSVPKADPQDLIESDDDAADDEIEVSGTLGIFGNSASTIRRNENLDIPTFIRRGVALERPEKKL